MKEFIKYKFSELYVMSSGISTSKDQAGHGSPFVSFSSVFNNYFLPCSLRDRMFASEKEQKTYSVKKGDIFLTRTSETLDELGMSCVVTSDHPETTYSGFLKRLRPIQQKKVYHKYMAFYLRSKLFRKTMNNNAVMTLRCSLNEQIFSYLDLLLPDYNEQIKIGDFLYLIHQKIELNNRINAELEGMAKLLYDYWFVQFEFPITADQAAAMGKPHLESKPYKSSGGPMTHNPTLKRNIPEGWSNGLVGAQLGKTLKTTKIPASEYLDHGDTPIIDQSTKFICGYTNNESAVLNADHSHIVFGDHTRILKLINFDFAKGADGTQILYSKNPNLPQHLFYHSLLKIDLSSYGYARHFKFLKDTQTIIPDQDTANKFEEAVSLFHDMIRDNRTQNQHLTSLRDWLLPMLMNGQVTVK